MLERTVLLILAFYILNLSKSHSWALPLTLSERDAAAKSLDIEVPPPEILRFMRRFGYLEPSPSDSEALYHESAIIDALKNIQKFGAINQTGKLDTETLKLLSKPRCGVPDMKAMPYYQRLEDMQTAPHAIRNRLKRYVLGARTWSKRHLKYFIANWSLKIPKFQIERDIARTFALWSRYSGLHFQRVNDTSADIIVGFGSHYHGDNFPFDGPGNILAHAYYPYEMGSWGGDIHFDEDEDWKENSSDLSNGVDFFSVAAHEIGHSLGLAHSSVYSSIMFPYYKGPEHSTLDYDDTLAMYEMYFSKPLDGDDNLYDEEVPPSTTDSAGSDSFTTINPQPASDTPPTCDEDCDSIENHERRNVLFNITSTNRTSSIDRPELSKIPNICAGHFDAVTLINGSVHIFKQQYVWKLTERYTIANGYPQSIWELFPFLPRNVKRIDAAYDRFDGATVFFIGNNFWVFRGSQALENSPKPLSDLIGSENKIPQVDAVMMWSKNNYTYLFAGSQFWRYDDRLKLLDIGYPRSMRRWTGIPDSLSAAITLTNGKTYFFKDNIYWLYNNKDVRPERGYPRRASIAWLHCSSPTKTPLRNSQTSISFISFSSST